MATALRKKGYSMNEIASELKVSKASVSIWVRDIVLTGLQKEKLSKNGRSVASIERRRVSRLKNQQQKIDNITTFAKRDFENISLHELKIIGIILYWGEGGKTKHGMARVSNSDPAVVRVMMRFFREICMVPEKKFRGHIHTFEGADVNKTEIYWSKITGIPRSQFHKTYLKQSIASLHKRKTLPYGTFDICVCDTHLFHVIMGWIERIKELII